MLLLLWWSLFALVPAEDESDTMVFSGDDSADEKMVLGRVGGCR